MPILFTWVTIPRLLKSSILKGLPAVSLPANHQIQASKYLQEINRLKLIVSKLGVNNVEGYQETNKNFGNRIALQRNLRIMGKFIYTSSPVGQVGAMVSGLDPKDLFDQVFYGMLFHG